MKVTKIVLCVCLLVSPSVASAQTSAVESGDAANTMVEGLGRMMIAMRYLADKQNLGCDDSGISLAGVLLMTGQAISAGDNFITQCRRAAQTAGWFGKQASLPIGQASVWGGVFRGGEAQRISRIQLGRRQTFAVAAGDQVEADWDLFLEDADGNVLCEDLRPGSTASVATMPQPGRHYSVRLKNATENGAPSFGMFGLVQVGN